MRPTVYYKRLYPLGNPPVFNLRCFVWSRYTVMTVLGLIVHQKRLVAGLLGHSGTEGPSLRDALVLLTPLAYFLPVLPLQGHVFALVGCGCMSLSRITR